MNASEVASKINALKEIYGDLEVMVNVQGGESDYLKKVTEVDIEDTIHDEDGNFMDERLIVITCE